MSKRRLKTPPPSRPAAARVKHARAPYWIAAVLGAAACLLYSRSWQYGFAGDVNSGLYRPVAGAYYVTIGALTGLRPAGYHIAQILLYGLNVATVFLFLWRISRRAPAIPAAAALLFLAHPIHTEVVNDIKNADELLCLQFLLMSGLSWLMFADTARAKWRYLSLAAYALAVCSKETGVPMIVIFPALWYFFRDRPLRESLNASIPFAAIALAYAGLRYAVLASEPPTSVVTLLNNALMAANDRATQIASAFVYLSRYVRMLFWPHPLSVDYGYNAIPLHTFADPAVWLSIGLLAALAGVFAWGFRSRRVESFAVLWFAASIVAVSNIFFLVPTNFGERFLYISSVLVCYLAAHWLFRAARASATAPLAECLGSPVIVAPLLLVVGVSSVRTVSRTREWREQITLFKADVAKFPNSARLNNYFGNLLYLEGERLLGDSTFAGIGHEDLVNAKAHLERGLSIDGRFQEMHAALGMADYRLKDCKDAIPVLKKSLPFESSRDAAVEMLADCYKQVETPEAALALFRELDEQGIEYPPGWFQLGNDAAARGDVESSVRYFSRFLARRPDNAAAHFNLASALHQKGRFAESLASADRCASLDAPPEVAARCLILGADDLIRLGRQPEAYQHLERAKTLDPKGPWIRK